MCVWRKITRLKCFLFVCLLRYYGARVTIWRPRQDRIVDYKLWNNSFFLCGKQITRILSEEMKVSGHDRVQWWIRWTFSCTLERDLAVSQMPMVRVKKLSHWSRQDYWVVESIKREYWLVCLCTLWINCSRFGNRCTVRRVCLSWRNYNCKWKLDCLIKTTAD